MVKLYFEPITQCETLCANVWHRVKCEFTKWKVEPCPPPGLIIPVVDVT